MQQRTRILVTGATGYVGGRLIPRLMELPGLTLRLFVRDTARIQGRGWDALEIFEGDAGNFDALQSALREVDIAYYLIHSMDSAGRNFAERDRLAAEGFGRAAAACGVKKIIYLGGLGDSQDSTLSKHLASRHQTGVELARHGVPVVEFRAGMIIGSGSLSFEMLRYLTERVPIMIAPKWVKTRSQAIAIRDVLAYLIEALHYQAKAHEIFEIGASEALSYEQMIQLYAKERRLKRIIISVPVLTPRLSSYWVNLVTPLPMAIARPLIDGLKNELVVTSQKALQTFSVKPLSVAEALRLALIRTLSDEVETRWSTALSSSSSESSRAVVFRATEGLIIEERRRMTRAHRQRAFKVISSLGGERGYFYAQWLWEIRGWIDRLIGGVGLRRGRRNATSLQVGDALDFWRVEQIHENEVLRLRAEMKVPGRAWLEFRILARQEGCEIIQRAIFEPKGLFGLLYWYGIYPIHAFIFDGMLSKIVLEIEREP